MRSISSMTSKGQVTIPKEIRDTLGLKPYDKIAFLMAEGHVTLYKAYPSLRDLMGSLPASEIPIEAWDDIVQDDVAQHYGERLAKERT